MNIRKKLGDLNFSEIARQQSAPVTEDSPPAEELGAPPISPRVPIAELAVRGGTALQSERQRLVLLKVDPKRCRPWKYHDRHPSWYTPENCADLIETFPKEGQRQPVLARRIENDPNFDYELIYGMRRRFAAEHCGLPLRLETTDANDKQCAVLMHLENADRQDITAMERALSIARQLKEHVFETQEEMALAKNISPTTMTQYIKAAAIMEHDAIAKLFPDPKVVSVNKAYKLQTRLTDSRCRDLILAAARHLGKTPDKHSPTRLLEMLFTAPDRSKRSDALRKSFNVGKEGKMDLYRNPKGKVTLAFTTGCWTLENASDVVAAVQTAVNELTKEA